MKRVFAFVIACGMAACMTGCKKNEQSSQTESSAQSQADAVKYSMTSEMEIVVNELEAVQTTESSVNTEVVPFDKQYAETIRKYFEAVEKQDVAAYKETVYPPYLEPYSAYLEKNGSTLESAFKGMGKQFDEDGYDGWHLVRLEVGYHPSQDIEGFFKAYEEAGVFDKAFEEKCMDECEEICDIQFSLYALYEGDTEPTLLEKNRLEFHTVKIGGCASREGLAGCARVALFGEFGFDVVDYVGVAHELEAVFWVLKLGGCGGAVEEQ